MRFVIFYRKPEFQKDSYPWQEIKNSAQDAAEFINQLGEDYDCLIFKETTLDHLYELADEGE